MKKALITGITGQDGSYLAELLLEKGYEVHGLVRRVAFEDQRVRHGRIGHIMDQLILHPGDLLDYASIVKAVMLSEPDECYHLAAQSFVALSFRDETTTMQMNILGTAYVFSALERFAQGCRVYFAGSSEMFGDVEETPQDEYTPFNPRSPYGISKVAGFNLAKYYRAAYGMFVCSGIMFNHEGPRRGMEFVTRKITRHIAMQALGKTNEPLIVGNLDAVRDWGAAWEYVDAMWQMLQMEHPADLVIATGESHSVREFIKTAYEVILGVDQLMWVGDGDQEIGKITIHDTCAWSDRSIEMASNIPMTAVKVSQDLFRPAEVHTLCGNSCKAQTMIGWRSLVRFRKLVEVMCEAELQGLSGIDHRERHDVVYKQIERS